MDVQEIYNCFLEKDIRFFTGVPDSLLKDICFYIEDNTDRQNHIIAANEGNAVGIALGYSSVNGKSSPGVFSKFRFRKLYKSIIIPSR